MSKSKNEIPIIDCSKISGPLEEIQDMEEFKAFAKELGDGMKGIGFVYFVNHGVHPSIVDRAQEITKKFFQLSKETKEKYKKIDAVENFHGFTAQEDEILDENNKNGSSAEIKEAFDFWGLEAHKESNYPKEVPGLKRAIDSFRDSLVELTSKILRAFALYLELEDKDFFIKKHKAFLEDETVQSHNTIRSNYYMPVDEDFEVKEDSLRLTEHQDWGTVTFLIQDATGGLEAKKRNGEWASVIPIKDSIVFNAGLMLEMWSGGLFPATPHRVRLFKDVALTLRQSLGFFLQPDGNSNCLPIVKEQPNWNPVYPKVDKETHFEYFKDRVRGSRAY